MLTLELSSYVLEIPNDAYTTLSQNLIGYSTLSQETYDAIRRDETSKSIVVMADFTFNSKY